MTAMDALKASQIKWKRLRSFSYTIAFVAVAGGVGAYLMTGGGVLLDAEGFVTRCKVAVASPWPDARVRKIGVRPGDWVEAGQTIAVVESAAMSRSLADLAVETARVTSRLAQLEGRRSVVKALLPLGRANADQTTSFLGVLTNAQSRGLVVNRSMQQMTDAKLQAMDRMLSLQAEETALETEINSNKGALQQVSGAYDDVRHAYGDGNLAAPASGYIGSRVAMVGEVLDAGRADVANIYTGPSYVLAYIPESYLFAIEDGQKVSVKGRGKIIPGYIEKVLPVTDALPPEFQLPNRVRGRGQLVRVAISGGENFAVDEKIQITNCLLNGCRIGVREMIQAAFPGTRRSRNDPEAPRANTVKGLLEGMKTLQPAAQEVASACASSVPHTMNSPATSERSNTPATSVVR
jgi:multidrug resistance efflux pump